MSTQQPLNDSSPSAESDKVDVTANITRKKTTISTYRDFRSYINDENNLINNRVTWILTIHGFLYATYGFTLQKQFEIVSKPIHRYLPPELLRISPACNAYAQTEFFLIFITAVGIMISFSGITSINAATSAIKHIARLYRIQTNARPFIYDPPSIGDTLTVSDTSRDTICYEADTDIFLPAITGGGALINADAGFRAARLIPRTLIISWLMSLIISVWLSNFPFRDKCGYNIYLFIAHFFY